MSRFVAYLVFLAALAAAAALYSQRQLILRRSGPAPEIAQADVRRIDQLYSRNPREAEAAEEHLKIRGSAALPAVQAALRDARLERRKAALKACGVLGPAAAQAVEEVASHLRHRELTEEAALALSFMGPEAYGPLRLALGSDDPVVRREALRSIGKLRARAPLEARIVTPLLVAALRDEDEDVREVAATYLGIVHELPGEAVPALMGALEDSDVEVRRAAAGALGSFGDEAREAAPALRKAAGDRDPDLAREAGLALIRLGQR